MPPRRKTLEFDTYFPSAPETTALPGAKLIPTAAIDDNPEQPRTGELQGIEELAQSIIEYGLLQPIIVAPSLAKPGRWHCLAGHRRLAAFRWLFAHAPVEEASRWAEIPVIERDTPTEDRLIVALLENLSRQNLSDADTITALKLLRDLRQWSGAEIARRLGVTRGWVSHQLSIAGDEDLAQRVQAGELSIAKATEIRLARSPEQRDAALRAALHGEPLRVIRQEARGTAGGAGGATPAQTYSDYTDAPPTATASADAGVRDLAELAEQLGITLKVDELELFKLLRSAIQGRTRTVSAAAVLRLARADLRATAALVRTKAAETRSR